MENKIIFYGNLISIFKKKINHVDTLALIDSVLFVKTLASKNLSSVYLYRGKKEPICLVRKIEEVNNVYYSYGEQGVVSGMIN